VAYNGEMKSRVKENKREKQIKKDLPFRGSAITVMGKVKAESFLLFLLPYLNQYVTAISADL
jgi:hypothetical protein